MNSNKELRDVFTRNKSQSFWIFSPKFRSFSGNPPLEDSFDEMMSQLGDLEAEKGLDDSLDEMISQIDEMEHQRQLKVENWLQQNATVGREKKDSKRKPKRSKPNDSDKENSGGDQQNNPQPKKSQKKESNQNSSNQINFNLVSSANNQRNNSLVQNSANSNLFGQQCLERQRMMFEFMKAEQELYLEIIKKD